MTVNHIDDIVNLIDYIHSDERSLMIFIQPTDAREHQLHGSNFLSYVAPAMGSSQLCAWRLTVDPHTTGQPHRVSHEEVFAVLEGSFEITIAGDHRQLSPGDVAFVPAGTSIQVDNDGDRIARAWVTTSVGLTAELADGTSLAPPWVR